jgi:glycosyltransferase involved in cell wall biosynthesis
LNRTITVDTEVNVSLLPQDTRADSVRQIAAEAQHPSGIVGVVAIGRNEGERLQRCLHSMADNRGLLVYVDSGSSDDSVAMSRALGVTAVELDMSIPFTAARARNAGFEALLQAQPQTDYVFFVDGDCEVASGWIQEAAEFLDTRRDVGVVWGCRRELFPEKSVYNLLCDIEWQDLPVGETPICGGDAVIRVEAFRAAVGYRPDLICGEEPELCVRLRQAGWRIWRLNRDMTRHDAAVYRFGQWWKRMLRGGYAYALIASIHGAPPERLWVAETRRAWIWGLCIPLCTLLLSLSFGWPGLLLLLIYPLQVARLARTGRHSTRENWLRAGSLVLSKFPEMLGQLKFLRDRLRRAQSRIIEYK